MEYSRALGIMARPMTWVWNRQAKPLTKKSQAKALAIMKRMKAKGIKHSGFEPAARHYSEMIAVELPEAKVNALGLDIDRMICRKRRKRAPR